MPEKILIIDDDLDTLRLVGLMLQKQGYQIAAANNGPQGLQLAFQTPPDLILLDVMMPGMDGYEVARNLRANEKTVNIPILMFTAKSQLDDKVTGFEAGADDYLTKPTHPSELHAHVKALLARSAKTRLNPVTNPTEPSGYQIGVLASRGGLGVTTVASNLAAALQKRNSASVVLADFCLGTSLLPIELNLLPMTGLTDLLQMPPAEITRQAIKEHLLMHASGIDILVASAQPRQAQAREGSAEQFQTILQRLRFMARFSIVDLGTGLNALNQKLLPGLDEIVLVVEPFDNALIHARTFLDDLLTLGIEKSRVHMVANYRLRSESQLSVPQVQERMNFPVDATFTPAPELLLQAARQHSLAYTVQQESLTTQQYNAFASKVEARAPRAA